MAAAMALVASAASANAQAALGTAFTYQGRLTDAGLPASGTYDLEFRLFDAATAGTQVGGTVARSGVVVSSGLFTTSLDFGASAFVGSARWLEIAVKAAAASSYTVLAPRQELTPAPSALWTARAGEAAAVAGGSLVAPAGYGSVGVNTPNPSGAALVVSGGPLQNVISDGFEDGTLSPFATSGTPWTVVTGTANPYSGTYAARNTAYLPSMTATLTFSFTVATPAQVSFAQRVRMEEGFDFLHFYIDGTLVASFTGFPPVEAQWKRHTYDVGPGSHTLTWEMVTDNIVQYPRPEDGASVDDLQIVTSQPALVALGRVGIGTAMPLDMLQVAGDARVGVGTTGCVKDADGTVVAGTCSSDARFKANVEPFAPMLDRVAQLEPVEFDWRAAEFPEKGFGERRSFGLIAQDVEKLFPELVATDAQGYKAVNYSRLPLVLLQALKEGHARIEAERAQNDRLEQRLADLERRIAR